MRTWRLTAKTSRTIGALGASSGARYASLLLHEEDAAGHVPDKPVDAVHEAVARDSAAGDDAPVSSRKLS
ncbi:unnamed protein product [Phytophthora fragariaefolia]|uniref:Unnamed protein product n=1 Tax=Phytophthora fragariaefolia TaxID=1490495 RepID=A0A9W6XQ39_9STRA|nr:unnamed protein product [Phytophthora fragariaefolia]